MKTFKPTRKERFKFPWLETRANKVMSTIACSYCRVYGHAASFVLTSYGEYNKLLQLMLAMLIS